jgi:hypothetical protein
MHNNVMDEAYQPGAKWTSKDGKRNVVVVSDELGFRGPAFMIRNLDSGRENRIEIQGLMKKFRYTGFDPAFADPT